MILHYIWIIFVLGVLFIWIKLINASEGCYFNNIIARLLILLLYSIFSQKMSLLQESGFGTSDLQELQEKLKQVSTEMQQHAKEGKYLQAASCRANVQKLKKQLDTKKVVQVEKRQKKENKDVKKFLREEVEDFNKEWDGKIADFVQKGKKSLIELKEKHSKQKAEQWQKVGGQLPQKWKQSSECLNLRKIEESMAKQQDYVQAHKVQKSIKELCRKEQQMWQKCKQQKMDTVIQTLKARQQIQYKALEKRIESGKAQLQLQRLKAQAKMALKHSNITKDIRSDNKKQFLATKGEMKSKIDVLSPSKSRLLSPNTRSKILFMTR